MWKEFGAGVALGVVVGGGYGLVEQNNATQEAVAVAQANAEHISKLAPAVTRYDKCVAALGKTTMNVRDMDTIATFCEPGTTYVVAINTKSDKSHEAITKVASASDYQGAHQQAAIDADKAAVLAAQNDVPTNDKGYPMVFAYLGGIVGGIGGIGVGVVRKETKARRNRAMI